MSDKILTVLAIFIAIIILCVNWYFYEQSVKCKAMGGQLTRGFLTGYVCTKELIYGDGIVVKDDLVELNGGKNE